jgi:hypothetical protein
MTQMMCLLHQLQMPQCNFASPVHVYSADMPASHQALLPSAVGYGMASEALSEYALLLKSVLEVPTPRREMVEQQAVVHQMD